MGSPSPAASSTLSAKSAHGGQGEAWNRGREEPTKLDYRVVGSEGGGEGGEGGKGGEGGDGGDERAPVGGWGVAHRHRPRRLRGRETGGWYRGEATAEVNRQGEERRQ